MKKLLILLLFLTSSAYGEIYTWTDSKGTKHYTNSEYEIPERYRKKAKVLDLGLGPKTDGGQAQPGAAAAPQASTPTMPAPQSAAPASPAPQPAAAAPPTVRPEPPPPAKVKQKQETWRRKRSKASEAED